MKRISILSLALAALLSSGAFASGGSYNYGYDAPKPKPKPVDTRYEYGKTIYQGRATNIGKIKFCVNDGEAISPVKTSTLRPFKRTSVRNLTSNLYNCETSQKASETISSKDLSYIVYYLNKRFRLRLNNG